MPPAGASGSGIGEQAKTARRAGGRSRLGWKPGHPAAIDPGQAEQTRPGRSRSVRRRVLHLDRPGQARYPCGRDDGDGITSQAGKLRLRARIRTKQPAGKDRKYRTVIRPALLSPAYYPVKSKKETRVVQGARNGRINWPRRTSPGGRAGPYLDPAAAGPGRILAPADHLDPRMAAARLLRGRVLLGRGIRRPGHGGTRARQLRAVHRPRASPATAAWPTCCPKPSPRSPGSPPSWSKTSNAPPAISTIR